VPEPTFPRPPEIPPGSGHQQTGSVAQTRSLARPARPAWQGCGAQSLEDLTIHPVAYRLEEADQLKKGQRLRRSERLHLLILAALIFVVSAQFRSQVSGSSALDATSAFGIVALTSYAAFSCCERLYLRWRAAATLLLRAALASYAVAALLYVSVSDVPTAKWSRAFGDVRFAMAFKVGRSACCRRQLRACCWQFPSRTGGGRSSPACCLPARRAGKQGACRPFNGALLDAGASAAADAGLHPQLQQAPEHVRLPAALCA
jgi:hypothetical protein